MKWQSTVKPPFQGAYVCGDLGSTEHNKRMKYDDEPLICASVFASGPGSTSRTYPDLKGSVFASSLVNLMCWVRISRSTTVSAMGQRSQDLYHMDFQNNMDQYPVHPTDCCFSHARKTQEVSISSSRCDLSTYNRASRKRGNQRSIPNGVGISHLENGRCKATSTVSCTSVSTRKPIMLPQELRDQTYMGLIFRYRYGAR